MSLRRFARAFTLIELLVVLVIIGLIAGTMVLTMGDDQRRGKLQNELERARAVIALALEEAQLRGMEIGLQVEADRYRFLVWKEERWQALTDSDPAFAWHSLPEGLSVAVALDGITQALRLPGMQVDAQGRVTVLPPEERARLRALRKAQEADENASVVPKEDGVDGEKAQRDTTLAGGTSAEGAQANEKFAEDENPEKRLLPQILLMSSGEVTPFLLAIGAKDEPAVFWRLRAQASGCMKREGPFDGDVDADLQLEWLAPEGDDDVCR